MDKESVILLQKIDCNCNDCKFMERNFEKHKQSIALHQQWQLDYFNTIKNKLIKKAQKWETEGETEKAKSLLREAETMKFQFDKSEVSINYGKCNKLNKDVSFVPNVCQIDTQECFEHRRD